MKNAFVFGIILFCLFLFPQGTHAQSSAYTISNFTSDITIEKDTSLQIIETIAVRFNEPRHGIFRTIPYRYTNNGKQLTTKVTIDSVRDDSGNRVNYEVSKTDGNVQIKIGDSNIEVFGDYIYKITYHVEGVIQRYDDHDELYWNVTGDGWDTTIENAITTVHSPNASITKVDCFAGLFGSTTKDCSSSFETTTATFATTNELGEGKDFTIVVGLSKENQLVFPGVIETFWSTLLDNSIYLLSVLPVFLFGYLWWKKGRDLKFAGENVYYRPDNAKVVTKPLFYREHLPMVYSPIQNLSPSEIGTLVDQRVDVNDVVAEITELARLGYIKIERIVKDKLIGKDTDYVFIKLKEDSMPLKEYQTYLFESIFTDSFSTKSVPKLTKILKDKKNDLQRYIKLANENKLVTLSALQTDFYTKLESFKKKLYKEMADQKYFDGRPDRKRETWIALFVVASLVMFWLMITLTGMLGNPWPMIIWGVLEVPTFIFAYSMPRRNAWGYSLYRQIEGLAFYLQKGKWREEIAEKHLFFAEMLPIAISLRIVDQLAKEMDSLGVAPPSYMHGFVAHSFAKDFSNFESSANKSVVAGAPRSGGSWSGGSGFSGGSSGGGFGGGGGGSW